MQERLKIIDQLSLDEQEFVRSLQNDPRAFGINVTPSRAKGPDVSMSKEEFIKTFGETPKPRYKLLPINFLMPSLPEYLNSARRHLEQYPDLSNQPETKRRKTIEKLLAGAARRYHARCERYFERRRWRQARQQPRYTNHIIWAARYQVCEVECDQIAADEPLISPSSITQTISRVLKRLGLRNRKDQGRPPKPPAKHRRKGG